MKNSANPQRIRNFWEPTYDPNAKEYKFWDATPENIIHSKGIQKYIVKLGIFKNAKINYLTDFTFEDVDFIDTLEGEQRKFTFKKCRFKGCSFRDAKFINVKFTECIFELSTFALGFYSNCEFRNCSYKKIGVSGNAMQFEECYINPELFLKDLYLNSKLDILKENQTTLQYQKFQQAKTKAVIARKFTEMKPIRSDIEYHILSIKTARRLEVLLNISQSYYYLLNGKKVDKVKNFFNFLFSSLEYPVLIFYGWLSGWGYKIGKVVFIGLAVILLFSIVNNFLIFQDSSFSDSILKTLEYWLLFGYTKYDFKIIPEGFQWLIFLNSVFGLIWFSAIIPIIINKLGKSNE